MAIIREDGPSAVLLCVDGYENGVTSGCFYPGAGENGREIRSLNQFLVGLDRLLGRGAPCGERLKRSFRPTEEEGWRLPERQGLRRGRLATFEVRILFRCHTSWQGTVSWLEAGREEIFRSVLELVLLLDSALGGCLEPGTGPAGWETPPLPIHRTG